MQLNKAISFRLIQLMAERQMTTYMLFTKTGLAKTTVYNMVGSKNEAVNLKSLHVICQGLDITLEEFFHSDLFSNENLDP